MTTLRGHIRLNDQYSLVLVHKCASTSFTLGAQRQFLPFQGPDKPISTPETIMVIRHPLKRVISWWRNQVRGKKRLSDVHHGILGGDKHDAELDSVLERIIRTPDELRDPHFCTYGRYLEFTPNARLVALEKLSEQWPSGVPFPMTPHKKNVTEGEVEEPSSEVAAAFEEAYLADFLRWEETIAEMDDE